MKVVDLFSGCGGMSRGFIDAGMEVVAAYDFWKPAVDLYRLNFNGHKIFQKDLSNYLDSISHIKQWEPEVIIGGPPCQDFSHAGKREEGERANLTEIFAKIVNEITPRWFVMENVDRIEKSEAYKKAKIILKDSGYGITEKIIDVSYYGVPQKRKRFFCIGRRNTNDSFLIDSLNKKKTNEPMTLFDYFGDSLGIEYYYRHPRNYNRRAIFSIYEPSPTIRGVNRPLPKGYKGHKGDPVPVSEKIRALTTKERAMIQTFPADFIWLGSKTDLEQLIGNAVPVKIAEFVAKAVIEFEECNE